MSNTQFAFIGRDKVPTREALQASIDTLGFDLQLDPAFTPFDDEGFSPCVLQGEADIGFEIYYEPAADIIDDDEEFKAISQNRDFCISLCWSGSMKDYAAVMIVSTALAHDFGAVISYEGDDPEPLEELITNTAAAIEEAKAEEARELAAEEALKQAKAAGSPEEALEQELKKMIGCSVTGMHIDGLLSMSIDNRYRVTCKAFACIGEDKREIQVSRYTKLRARQIALMETWDGEPNAEQEAAWKSLENDLERADREDTEASEQFRREVESWPETVEVSNVEWHAPDTLQFQFKELTNARISIFAIDSMMFATTLQSDLLSFRITNESVELDEYV
ncbi:MAG: hypothetical protein MI754_18215 [Chromatiales bacterium]|nr:hypothetical protein [Chromatiales bacterium]